jgi:hypothetical protein
MSVTLLSEGFEGSFPADNGWSVSDANSAGTAAYWNDVSSSFGGEGTHGGSWKGYCAGSGYAGSSTSPTYQNSMNASMSKSVNLGGLSSASLTFWYKIPSIESGNYDHLRAYIDSTKVFDVSATTTSWTQSTISLNSYLGTNRTLKFEFYSDSSGTAEGAYLDDILVTGERSSGPANNNFANRASISGTTATVTGTNVGATKESGEPNHAGNTGGKSVWWTWTAPSSGRVQIDTIGSNFDTTLGVYTGGSVSSLTTVASNDDGGGNGTSKVTFNAVRGTTYQIGVDGYSGASGNITVHIPPVAPQPPTNVAATDGTYTNKVRVTWTASANATAYEVWRNTSNSSGTATKLTSSDVTGTSYDDTTATAGTTYWYWVKAKNVSGTSSFSAADSGYPPPIPPAVSGDSYEVDDTAAQAKTIATDGTTQTHSLHVGSDVDWVKFTLTQRSNVVLETNGSAGDTEMRLYGPNSSTTLVEYDDDDGNGTFSRIDRSGANALDAGTYYVRIGEYGSNNAISSYTISVHTAEVYRLWDHWAGSWSDAEKTSSNTDDDLMCWAAVASNVLAWTGWESAGNMTGADQVFRYFQDHWTDERGSPEYAWDWWFDGTNDSQGWNGWSQVDMAGGGFSLDQTFSDYFHSEATDAQAMIAISQFLRSGYGTTLSLRGAGAHEITVWGFDYDPSDPTNFRGIWVTDSDDGISDNPTDELRYYTVASRNSQWYLNDYNGSNGWYIDSVWGLDRMPPPAPTSQATARGAAIRLPDWAVTGMAGEPGAGPSGPSTVDEPKGPSSAPPEPAAPAPAPPSAPLYETQLPFQVSYVSRFDTDGDGDQELLLAPANGGIVLQKFQTGLPASSVMFGGNEHYSCVYGYVDPSGARFVVAGGARGVDVFGNSAGAWSLTRHIELGYSAKRLAAADVDRDGDVDFVVGAEGTFANGSGVALILLRNDSGTYTPSILQDDFASWTSEGTRYSTQVGDVVVGDVSGDGYPDLFISACKPCPQGCAYITWEMLSDGRGGYSGLRYDNVRWDKLALADLNGDGNLDLAATGPACLWVAYGDGARIPFTWQQAFRFPGDWDFIKGMDVVDWDGDGDNDIVIGGVTQNLVLLKNTGGGAFSSETLGRTDCGIGRIVASCENEARWVAASNCNGVTIWTTAECLVCPRHNPDNPLDATGDGVVSALDVLVIVNYLNERGFGPIPSTGLAEWSQFFVDVSGDNIATPADALLVINFINSLEATLGEGEAVVPPVASVLVPGVVPDRNFADTATSGESELVFALQEVFGQRLPPAGGDTERHSLSGIAGSTAAPSEDAVASSELEAILPEIAEDVFYGWGQAA